MIPPKRFLTGGCSEGLGAFRFFFKNTDEGHDEPGLNCNIGSITRIGCLLIKEIYYHVLIAMGGVERYSTYLRVAVMVYLV